ncbi:MAG: MFS transporter [Methanomassiliicoccales archaeon]|nr:MFS transporter [Methanomassiliicoccales archaeon]
MAPLDSTIVSVSLPQIAADLDMGYAEIIWVPTAYLVTLAVTILVMGRVSDVVGRKSIFLMGFGVFTASSLLCSLSASGAELILFRIIQGFGGACIGSTSAAIITETYPSNERGKALGINALAVYLGMSLGPPLGGFLTHAFGWRSVFWVNVPIGIAVILLAHFKIKASSPEARRGRLDFPGVASFALMLVSFLVALTLGDQWGWTSPQTLALLIMAVLGFVAFVGVERVKGEGALLDPRLFTRNRMFAASNVSAFLNYTSFFGVTIIISFYLQRLLGLTSLEAGWILLIMPVTMALISPISGRLSDRLGSRLLASAGMFIIAAGLAWMAGISTSSTPLHTEVGLFVIGAGMGIFSSPNTSAVMGSVGRSKLGLASGTLATMRVTGQATSLALMGAIVSTVAANAAISAIFSGQGGDVAIDPSDFVRGMDVAFLVSSVIAVIGAFTSLARGGRPEQANTDVEAI